MPRNQEKRGERVLRNPDYRLDQSADAADIRSVVLSDQYLFSVYQHFYEKVSANLAQVDGEILEIGSGAGIGKIWLPDMVTTDLVPNKFLDEVVDGLRIPREKSSLSNLVLINAFHHLNDPERFLSDCANVLVNNGRIIMIEPYWGVAASLVYFFVHPEPFKPWARSWPLTKSGPWDSNQALPWIIFRRDLRLFEKKFPEMSLLSVEPIVGLSYLLSGGLYNRTRLSGEFLRKLLEAERRLGRYANPMRFFVSIVIEKKSK